MSFVSLLDGWAPETNSLRLQTLDSPCFGNHPMRGGTRCESGVTWEHHVCDQLRH